MKHSQYSIGPGHGDSIRAVANRRAGRRVRSAGQEGYGPLDWPLDGPDPREAHPTHGRLSPRRTEVGADVRGDPAQEARLLRQGPGGARRPLQRGGDPQGPVRQAVDPRATARPTRRSTRRRWIKTLGRASRGYSIYEMDGRYLSADRAGRRACPGHPVHLPRRAATPPAPHDRLPRRVAGGRQPPRRPPVRRGAGGRGRDLVPRIHRHPARHLAQGRGRRSRRGGLDEHRADDVIDRFEHGRPPPGRWPSRA